MAAMVSLKGGGCRNTGSCCRREAVAGHILSLVCVKDMSHIFIQKESFPFVGLSMGCALCTATERYQLVETQVKAISHGSLDINHDLMHKECC